MGEKKTVLEKCEKCNGTGEEWLNEECTKCGGAGDLLVYNTPAEPTAWDIAREEYVKKFGEEDMGNFPNHSDQDVWVSGFVEGFELYQQAMKSASEGFIQVNTANHLLIAKLRNQIWLMNTRKEIFQKEVGLKDYEAQYVTEMPEMKWQRQILDGKWVDIDDSQADSFHKVRRVPKND